MICRKCGKPIPDDSVFCQYCGCKMTETQSNTDKKQQKYWLPTAIAVCVVVLLVLVIKMSGSPTDKVQKAIDAIGTVTMDSQEKIQQAEELYENLSEKNQEKVENADVLADAREAYDRMAAAYEAAVEAVAEVKAVAYSADDGQLYVNPEDREVIVRAREAYEAAKEEGLADRLADQLKELEAAEQGLTNFHGSQLFQEAYENGQQGMHQKAIALYQELLEMYPNYPNAADAVYNLCYSLNTLAQDEYVKKNYEDALELFEQTLEQDPQNNIATNGVISCTMKVVEACFEDEEYEKVEKLLNAAIKRFGATQEFGSYQKKLQEELEEICPANGDYVEKKLVGGRGVLIVTAGNQNTLVKLESAEDRAEYRSFYIKANSTASISVADGVYRVKYTEGDTWYGKEEMFGEDAPYSQLDELVEFNTEYIEGYFHYTEISIDLYGSGLEITEISADAF